MVRTGSSPLVSVGAVALAVVCVACTESRNVTPWFRIESRRPVIDVPHLVRIGTKADVAWARIGGRWVKVTELRDFRVRAAAFADGNAVLFHHSDGEWRVLHANGDIAKVDPVCLLPVIDPTRPVIHCASCEVRNVGEDCRGTVLREVDSSGRVTRELHGDEPLAGRGFGVSVVGVLPDRSIVLTLEGGCRLFSIGTDGSRLLATKSGSRCETLEEWRDVLVRLGAVPVLWPEGARF